MSVSLFILTAFAAVGVFNVFCDTQLSAKDGKIEGKSSGSLVGFKPCLDENCDSYGPSSLETLGTKIVYEPLVSPAPIPGKSEDPRVHCLYLRPSAVKLFEDIETVYPDITAIKYSVLEDLIFYMNSFATLALSSCEPDMKLIDLVILAANSLKAQLTLQGAEHCKYESDEDNAEEPGKNEGVTKAPCNSESKNCYETTTKPKVEIPVAEVSTEQSESSVASSTEKSYEPSSTDEPSEMTSESMPCSNTVSTEHTCLSSTTEEYSEDEIIAEPEIPYVGSMRGIPGVHYPNYSDIPITTFTCADKKYIPGFYADLDTGCQVFHVCYEHRRESFLCPVGTIFNQPILACDYWYSSNCSLASVYYDVNEKTILEEEKIDVEVEELLTHIAKDEKLDESSDSQSVDSELEKIAPFFPVKAVVTDVEPVAEIPVKPAVTDVEEVASEIVDNLATTATKVISNARVIVKSIPEPETFKPVVKPVIPQFMKSGKKALKLEDLLASAVVPLAKAKLASIPISKVTALKTAIPVAGLAAKKASIPVAAAKAKLAAKVAAIPTAKAAVAAPVIAKAKLVSIPAVKAAVAAPVIAKAKMVAVPAAKAAVAAPVIAKGKMIAKAAVAAPIITKAKMAAIPAAKIAVAAPVIAKGKLAVPAVKVGAAKVAAKSSMPILKAKMVASAVPLAKTKFVPLMKVKGAPLLKAKMLALPLAKSKLAGPLPLAKVKLAKAAAISPLTKKALALGYMKLLKAKKVALMG